MRKFLFSVVGASSLLAVTMLAAPVVAQAASGLGPDSPYCGAWVGSVWKPNGNCTVPAASRTTNTTIAAETSSATTNGTPNSVQQRVHGMIVGWSDNMLTLQRGKLQLTVNDQPAIDHHATGRIEMGRKVIAEGYWKDGTFFVNEFVTQ